MDFFEYCLITILISFVFFAFGVGFGSELESNRFKSKAVVQGVAEYIPDEKGNPVWQWKK
jgi:hypothetical protein